jgi:hypothetical protein
MHGKGKNLGGLGSSLNVGHSVPDWYFIFNYSSFGKGSTNRIREERDPC